MRTDYSEDKAAIDKGVAITHLVREREIIVFFNGLHSDLI